MVKDSKKYAATGGRAHFNDGKPAAEAMLKTCFPCHQGIKDRDLVFTRYSPYTETHSMRHKPKNPKLLERRTP
jgi:Cytochrome P460